MKAASETNMDCEFLVVQQIQTLWKDTDTSTHVSDSESTMLQVNKSVGQDPECQKPAAMKVLRGSGSAPELQSSRNHIKMCLLTVGGERFPE